MGSEMCIRDRHMVLNTAARIVLDMRPCDPCFSGITLAASHCQDQVYKLCLLAHKVTAGQAPKYIADLLKPVAESSSRSALRASAHGDFGVRRPRMKIGKRVFFCGGTASAESATDRVETVPIYTLFRRKIKTCLFTASCGVSENNI